MTRLQHIALAAGLIVASAIPAAAEKTKNVLDLKSDITDSNIIYPESYELNTQKMFESWYLKNYTATDDRYKTQSDNVVSDAVIRDRLSKLNTVIEMPFNQIVRSYIERYTVKGRGGVAAMLGLSLYYMPIFEQALEEAGLPLELKYLPVIESGLNPNAVSKHGATGLWQFMLVTGKGMDLEINSLVDERRDPYASSKKAAKYLKSLYDTYGDWSLAIAAYNCGPGTVNKAIRRAGGDPKSHDFWSIYYYLPSETRGYFPMFVAANYVMNYYQYHNISPVLATKPLVTDTLMISNRVHFNQISHVLDIPIDELRVLNPQFRADVIPGRSDRQYTLVLPSQQVHAYLMSEDDILGYESAKYAQRIDVQPGDMPGDALAREIENEGFDDTPLIPAEESQTPVKKVADTGKGTKTVSHKVQPGETLASIAELYAVSQDQIKIWNNLSRNSLRTGQMLRITTTPALADAAGAREITQPKAETKKETKAPRKDNEWKKDQANKDSKPVKDTPKEPTKKKTTNNVADNSSKNTPVKETKKKTNDTANNNNNANTKTGKNGKNNTADNNTKNGKNSKNDTADNNTKNGKNSKNGKNGKNDTADNNTKNGKNSKNGKNNTADNNKKKAEPKAPANHEIKSGENLTTIAKKYGTTVDELKKANNMSGENIRAGESLKLPSKGKADSKKADSKNGKADSKNGKADTKNGKADTKNGKADTKNGGSKNGKADTKKDDTKAGKKGKADTKKADTGTSGKKSKKK